MTRSITTNWGAFENRNSRAKNWKSTRTDADTHRVPESSLNDNESALDRVRRMLAEEKARKSS